MNAPLPRPSGFAYAPMFPLGPDQTSWKKLDIPGVSTATCDGQTVLKIKPEALSELADNVLCRSGATAMNPITPITKANATPE